MHKCSIAVGRAVILDNSDVVCTGSSAVCPASINVADKTQCEDDSVCFNGVCLINYLVHYYYFVGCFYIQPVVGRIADDTFDRYLEHTIQDSIFIFEMVSCPSLYSNFRANRVLCSWGWKKLFWKVGFHPEPNKTQGSNAEQCRNLEHPLFKRYYPQPTLFPRTWDADGLIL